MDHTLARRRDWMLHCSACLAAALAGPALATTASTRRIVVLGDSLSAEYGLARGSGWVALLEQRLKTQGIPAQVLNASISGDTTAGGRARLAPLLKDKPSHLIIELGGNDALRGLPLASTRANLAAMIQAAQAVGTKVLLVGMQVPPNYGSAYAREFSDSFAQVAKAHRVALVPFLLAGVADRADALEWFQSDRIHPLAKAHPVMLDNVWKALKPLL